MIQLYLPKNTNYTKNGDIILTPISCTVSTELNGAWGIKLVHPIDSDKRWAYIVENAVIKAPSFNGEQLFRITQVDKSDGGVEAQGRPIFLDAANDCFLVDIRPTTVNGQTALNRILSPNGKYSASSDITTISTAYYELKNAMEAIAGEDDNSFLNRWGGEMLYDNYKIIINKRVGGDYGVQLLYRKNIASNGIRETVVMDEVATRIIPKAYNGRMLSTTNKWVDSPLINAYPTVYNRVIEYPNIALASDVEGSDTEGMTVCANQTALNNALIAAANKEYEAGIDKPSVSIDIDMVLLGNTEEYKDYAKLEKVSLGDTVHCRHSRLDIITDARIVALEYDSIRDMVSNVTIGDVQPNIMTVISSAANSVKKAITPSGTVIAGQIEGFINGALAQLRLQNSIAKKQDVRAILFEDLDPASPTFGAMALGTQGFQISRQRTADGNDWVWSTFGTAAGFNADYITAGKIDAIDINGSTITGGNIKGSTVTGGTVSGANIRVPFESTNTGGMVFRNGRIYIYDSSNNFIANISGDAKLASDPNTKGSFISVEPGRYFDLAVNNPTENVAYPFLRYLSSDKRLILGAPRDNSATNIQLDFRENYATLYTPLRTNGYLYATYNGALKQAISTDITIGSYTTLHFVNGLLVAMD